LKKKKNEKRKVLHKEEVNYKEKRNEVKKWDFSL